MIPIPYRRRKVLAWAITGVMLSVVVWYARTYRPTSIALDIRETSLAAREGRVRQARAARVEIGEAGLDSLLAQFHADSTLLVTRVPSGAEGAGVSAGMKDALAEAEGRSGGRVTATEPLPSNAEEPFVVEGFRVRVVGRYAQIGALLANLASLPQLTMVRGLRIHAVPDSLVRGVTPVAGAGVSSPTDSAGLGVVMADAGEAPFTAVATFTLHWFTLPGPRRDPRPASHAPAGPEGNP